MILDSLYGLVVWTRNRLYDLRVLPSYKGELPTVVVGNLAIGGTGKTPHTELIVRQLLAEGKHPAVLSRGYKRKTKGFLLADENSTVSDIGDEAMLLYRRLKEVPVAVCKDRLEGIRKIKTLCPEVNIVVLDDAMQYRRLRADTTVLLTRYNHLYPQDAYLPWGNLRDHKSESKRADIIIVTGCPADISETEKELIIGTLNPSEKQEVLFSTIRYDNLQFAIHNLPSFRRRSESTIHKSSLRVGVFAGIANPDAFIEQVKLLYGKVEKVVLFSDHHWYNTKDIKQLEDAITDKAIDLWLTTEKDIVRLIPHIGVVSESLSHTEFVSVSHPYDRLVSESHPLDRLVSESLPVLDSDLRQDEELSKNEELSSKEQQRQNEELSKNEELRKDEDFSPTLQNHLAYIPITAEII